MNIEEGRHDIRIAPGGPREKVDEATRLLEDGGFDVYEIPVRGLSEPEATINGRVYRGLKEIGSLASGEDAMQLD